MRLWIDCEFNSYKGQLMSLALVGEGDVQFYAVLPLPDEIDPWVQTNVVPILGAKPTPYRDAQDELETFLAAFDSVHIVADWPEDIAHFCDFLITGPGQRIDTPPLTMEVVRVDAPSKVPHNALWDAIGIRDFMLAEAALSHAAGQEAVAWQCRLIAIATGKLVDDWRECSKESFDIDGGRPRDGAYFRTEYRALYLAPPTTSAEVGQDGEQCRAASVASSAEDCASILEHHAAKWDITKLPVGGDLALLILRANEAAELLRALSRGVPEGKDGERYRYLCERHPLKMQRWLVGEVAEGKIDRKDLIDAAVDEQMARDYAAIAAQRKEGA